MRPSSKLKLLDAAVVVAGRDGIAGMTLDAVATEAGLTKAGLLYHFASKEAMLHAVQQHLLDEMQDHLLAALGRPLETATPDQRVRAYVDVITSRVLGKAELAFVLESIAHPELIEQWEAMVSQWSPRPASTTASALDLFVARMAADGLWLLNSTSETRLPPAVRRALVGRIEALLPAGEQSTETE